MPDRQIRNYFNIGYENNNDDGTQKKKITLMVMTTRQRNFITEHKHIKNRKKNLLAIMFFMRKIANPYIIWLILG